MSADKTIAVAFGGGGARGFAHIHIIETLNELGVKPVAISGTSIGAIMGTAMASGMEGREIRTYVEEVINKPRNFASRLWDARAPSWKELFAGGIRLGQFDIERIVSAFLPQQIPTEFSHLEIPTQLIATDYYGHYETVMKEGDLRSAIAASASIPAVFKPVKRNGRFLIDGGIYNILPFDHLKGLADIIIAVDVTGFPIGDNDVRPSTTDVVFGASQLMQQSSLALRLKSSPPDVFLEPQIHEFRVLDFLSANAILEASEPVRDQLKTKIGELLD